MKRPLFVAMVIAISGCSSGVESVVVQEPDGSHGMIAKCRLGSPWRCLDEVTEFCPHGYAPVSEPGHDDNVSPLSPGLLQRGQTWFIHVRCGKPAPPVCGGSMASPRSDAARLDGVDAGLE